MHWLVILSRSPPRRRPGRTRHGWDPPACWASPRCARRWQPSRRWTAGCSSGCGHSPRRWRSSPYPSPKRKMIRDPDWPGIRASHIRYPSKVLSIFKNIRPDSVIRHIHCLWAGYPVSGRIYVKISGIRLDIRHPLTYLASKPVYGLAPEPEI